MASAQPHDISIKGRKWVQVTGVSSVERFDANAFALVTSAGPLTIEGTNLHMKHLDLEQGIVEIEGTVNRVAYVSEQAQKKRVVGRLFR
ncbi:sporulation protein YabP [Alicyclobacillus sp.]|uniref:sporulation protein YabP n=1 Tax=Alicyclobacillus sp. TaxID=61169 RepID=UPI0025BDF3D9|nr:sporulation protein YabP [Alicyclobacillus sp.]MCL6517709.1 sporulation protein YabP [Alicyclobacillus sp.]